MLEARGLVCSNDARKKKYRENSDFFDSENYSKSHKITRLENKGCEEKK